MLVKQTLTKQCAPCSSTSAMILQERILVGRAAFSVNTIGWTSKITVNCHIKLSCTSFKIPEKDMQ